MFNLSEYRKKPDRLADLLPWAALVAPGTVLNKDGSLQRTLRFRGPDLESATRAQLVTANAHFNNALKRFTSGWAIYVEARREPDLPYPEAAAFPNPISLFIDAERRESFANPQENFVSKYYLTLQFLPEAPHKEKVSQIFLTKPAKSDQADYQKNLTFFLTATQRFLDMLRDIMFEVAFLKDQETLTYLHSTISPKNHPVLPAQTSIYLDAALADTPLVGGLTPKLGDYHLRTISLLHFPDSTVPALLDLLNQLPISYRWMTRFIALDKPQAEAEIKRYKRLWFAKRKGILQVMQEVFTKNESQLFDTAAISKAKDADAALQELGEDYVSFGYYTATITIMDADLERVTMMQREIERVINGLGFTTINETFNAVEAWLSSLPGHTYANVRAPLLHTLNLAHLLPFSAIWAGQECDEHLKAPAVMYLKTPSHTAFRLVNHIGDVGHLMVIGPTGAGKSVFLNMLALQFQRYQDAQIFIFDKGESFLASTLGVGGEFYELSLNNTDLIYQSKTGFQGLAQIDPSSLGNRLGGKERAEGVYFPYMTSASNEANNAENQNAKGIFQPLANIDQTTEMIWAFGWLQGLLSNEEITITPQIKQALWQALNSLAEMPRAQRTLTGLCAFLQHKILRQALATYTLEGSYGRLFDADSEAPCTNTWQCYEMEAVMSCPSIIAPLLSYLFHRLEKQLQGAPTLLIIDEAWLFLDHPIFAAKIRDWLKSLRKRNVSVVFATQSIEDALATSIAPALLESCPARIFLPNDRILEPQIKTSYLKLGLNERQLQILANASPKRQYYYQSSLGNRLFNLELGPIAKAFCATSQKDMLNKIKKILAEHSKEHFLKHYLAAQGLEWLIDYLTCIQNKNEKTISKN